MARRMPQLRGFRVAFVRRSDDHEAAVYDMSAFNAGDAKLDAHQTYEAQHGPSDPFDDTIRIRATEY
jgi:hypothetical protein